MAGVSPANLDNVAGTAAATQRKGITNAGELSRLALSIS
jgi:hypothetical protein